MASNPNAQGVPIQKFPVKIGSQIYQPNERDVIRAGGEGVVFNYGGKALKIYHNPNPDRDRKLQDFFAMKVKFPGEVIYPLEPVTANGMIAGFLMELLDPDNVPLAQLGVKNFCDANGFSLKDIAESFLRICEVVAAAHKNGFVIGDFNDLNERVIAASKAVKFIDFDSWQFGRWPCPVGTEKYLSPELYGIDLAQKPHFKPHHDWFSFSVLAFRSLLKQHPFLSGIHPSFSGVVARAKNKVTVLDRGVMPPPMGFYPNILSDELTAELLRHLKGETRQPFNRDVLQEFTESIAKCSCGAEYYGHRNQCPACSVVTSLDIRAALKKFGITVDELLATAGYIVHFQIQGKKLYIAAEENGIVVVYVWENGSVQKKTLFAAVKGSRYSFFGDNLVVCQNVFAKEPKLLVVDISGPQPKGAGMTDTNKMNGSSAVFSVSNKALYRMVDLYLMRSRIQHGNLVSDEVTRRLPGQTWFVAAQDDGPLDRLIGFQRFFTQYNWFLLVENPKEARFDQYEITIPQMEAGESLVDVSVKFATGQALVIIRSKKHSNEFVRLVQVDTVAATVIADQKLDVSQNEIFENGIHGRAFSFGMVTHPTSKGVVMHNLASGNRSIIPNSDKFVNSDASLFPFGDGIIVVSSNKVELMRKA